MVCNPHLTPQEHADNLESDYLLGRAVHASPSFGRHALESAMTLYSDVLINLP